MATLQIDQALAEKMLEKGVAVCAEQKFAGDHQQALLALRQGRCDVCSCLSDSLVQQLGEYLGQIDRTVKTVYRYEPEYGTMRKAGSPRAVTNRKVGINLVAWVERKSAALTSLGATLESVISESRRKLGCKNASPACYILDVQMVDDRDVQERRGFGVVIDSTYVRSIPIWSRSEVNVSQTSSGMDGSLLDSFDPEVAPENLLFEQGRGIEALPPAQRLALEHRLREIKVVLIRRLISDQLAYINIAKQWLTISDLEQIRSRKIGLGKVGGKAAGMLLAQRILNQVGDETLRKAVHTPESYFIGSDLIYIFMAMNGLMHWNDQKYKSEEQIRADYPHIQEAFRAGEFPPEVVQELQCLLGRLGNQPLIVRSSSQLEDNFGTSFAGKYNSYFCPNQASPEENLRTLTQAIASTYASTLKPEALLYRRSKGLQDYDERMAVLLQIVEGERFGRYFLPMGAGVAFSRNLYRWSPQIRKEDGFARLVWGLGTRAVERVGNDFPRLVALSHPTLQPDDAPEAIRRYSQHYVDVIDLEENIFKILPVTEVLAGNYPGLRQVFQLEGEGYLTSIRTRVMSSELPNLVITFDELLRRTAFPGLLSDMLRLLEENYHGAVDMEFTVRVKEFYGQPPEIQIALLQCRPQSLFKGVRPVKAPLDIPPENRIFSTHFMVPQGYLPNVRYVIFVPPEAYYQLNSQAERNELGHIIGKLNERLAGDTFICVGPGRWGTTNADLGVFVCYSDVCHAGALVELSGKDIGPAPEPSLGTHFFQDLMEAEIYPLCLNLDDERTEINRDFFYDTPNCLKDWIDVDETTAQSIRLIDASQVRKDHHLVIVMDDETAEAIAYLAPN